MQQQIPKTLSFALLDDLRYAVRGGRVPAWVKTVADLLRIKPVIATKPDGQISLAGFLLGGRNRAARFAKFVARRAQGGQKMEIGIGHAVCEEDARQLQQELQAHMPAAEKIVVNGLGTAIGVHGGPGTLLVSVSPVVSLDSLTSRPD